VLRHAVGRIVSALCTLLLVSVIIFAAVEILPGDVALRLLGREASPDAVAQLRERLHLNAPAGQRYVLWLGNSLRGNFGVSFASRRPVADVLAPRLRNTLFLSLFAFLLYIPLSLGPAVLGALHRDRPLDHGITAATIMVLSMPDFLLATVLLLVFAVVVPVLPPMSSVDSATTIPEFLRGIVLPAVTLALIMATHAIRMLRDNLIEVLDSGFIRMAELKGLPRRQIILRHALPNALIPTLNVTALNLAYLLAGVVVVERVFAFPGFGSITVDAMLLRDLPLIEASVLIAATVYIVGNLAADLLAIMLNPRLRA
jgi:peptide/nickel transport system permease protein